MADAPETRHCDAAEIVALLHSHGLRATKTRCLLLELLAATNAHPTAEDLLEKLRVRGVSAGVATVYQNLSTLAEHGLLARFIGRDGRARFDGNLSAHHHLICSRCGRIVDVTTDGPIGEVALVSPDCDLAEWSVERPRLEFLGVCPECRQRG